MPTTVNGIGTHYYGKRDAASRPGTCRSCGHHVNLETYTTRLWFVVIFIPIIPLKRVQILDYCPRCSRHYTANPEQYEMSRQLAVSGSLEQHRASPTVESALSTHAQYLSFHMHQEADAFREAAVTQFPDNADLLTGLASHLDQVGRWKEATPIYESILQLTPDSTTARYCLAWRRIQDGKLDEASELLDFLRRPGSGKSFNLELLKTLAEAHQKKGEHEKVLELCAIQLREHPDLGEKHSFRTFVSKSEKALKLESSLLPEKKFSFRSLLDSKSESHAPWVRWATYGAIASLIFAFGMVALNEYNRTHRNLYVLSAFAQPVLISIDGAPAIPIQNRGKVSISEGSHQITITGPVSKQIAADMRTPYLSRWLSSPVWILNVEGLSSPFENRITYSVVPQPPVSRWLEGEVVHVPHADYIFTNPPESMKVEGRNSVVRKTHVGNVPVQPSSLVMGLMRRPDQSVALTLAEGYLERSSNDSTLLGVYSQKIAGEANEKRVAEFLKARLWEPSISIPWHRAYINLRSMLGRQDELRHEYDERLKKNHNNSVLLYLRGYVSDNHDEQVRLYRRSLMKDQNLGWPALGLAANAGNLGDWPEAKKWVDIAAGSLVTDQSFRGLRHNVHMGLGDTVSLDAEYRSILQGQDVVEMMAAVHRLAESLAAQGKFDDVRREVIQWWSRMNGGQVAPNMPSPYDPMIDYVCGKLDDFLNRKTSEKEDDQVEYRFQFLLAALRPDDAVKLPRLEEITSEWTQQLQLSLCYSLCGNEPAAAMWRTRAIEKMKQGGTDQRRAADLLSCGEAPPLDAINDVLLRVNETPLFLASLARLFPDHRDEYVQRARKVNVSRHPPCLLVKKALEMP